MGGGGAIVREAAALTAALSAVSPVLYVMMGWVDGWGGVVATLLRVVMMGCGSDGDVPGKD